MRTSNLIFRILSGFAVLMACAIYSPLASAQTTQSSDNAARPQPTPVRVELPEAKAPARVAKANELYCGGFIQYAPAPNRLQIIGGEEEQEQRVYAQGDIVYINAGANEGVTVGQEFSVVRPRGQFTSDFSKKKGYLGVYTQELGRLRVIDVKERVSVARVEHSCELMLLGDLLRAANERVSPFTRNEAKLNRFADPNGKQRGRIVLSRDGREAPTVNDIIYIDLGTEDNIRPGDYFTIYRPLGKGNITGTLMDEEITPTAAAGFESERFKGGKFSNKAQRVQDPNNTGVYGPMITTPDVKDKRPRMPRKIVGEMVILSVQQRTATAVITRVAQEVHTGDFVELQ
ncbi:MAG TPA: hypothetical protein VJS44_17600 [Pyrinomonadaceae bacterium]|nr:hypothetical protein [Pyrinomonadaceae bacterium]